LCCSPLPALLRYCRADAGADLDARLGGGGGANTSAAAAGSEQQQQQQGFAAGTGGDDEGGEFEIVEEVEDIITALLEALRDKVSRGVGRDPRACETRASWQPLQR
jgi:hypothetical protein